MIYTVTMNPAIDYVMHVDRIEEGRTNRSAREELYFGGKGVNVSTVLAELGVESVALGFVAGFTGEALERAVSRRGVKTDFIRLREGYTRINVKLKADGREISLDGALLPIMETELNAEGPTICAEAAEVLLTKLDRLRAGDTLVLSGSVPNSLPRDFYRQILARLEGRGIRFVIDAAGELLRSTLEYKPFLIKPNLHELEELVGKTLATDTEIEAAAQSLREAGAANVLVSLGGEGAMLCDQFGQVHRQEARGSGAVNTVGAGDSMVAGFLVGCEVGLDYALKLGIAAGGATASVSGIATKEEILALL